MNTTLDSIAPDLLQTLASQAAARNVTVNDYLRQMLRLTNGSTATTPAAVENGTQPVASENGTPPKKKLEPIPTPDRTREMQWFHDHAREYIGQWVALDGDRLIAHGLDAKAVFAAARADGAYMPLVDSIEDPDLLYVF